MFQTGSVQRNAFQLGGLAAVVVSAAFQQGAFQGGAFQVYSGYAVAPTTASSAFQQDAFQQGAFQMYGGTYVVPIPTPDVRKPSNWHPDDAIQPRRAERPIIYVDDKGRPIEAGATPLPAVEPAEQASAAREDIPLDLLASQLAVEAQAIAAMAMARIDDELARFLIIQQIEALAAEDARNMAMIQQIILDVMARELDDEEAMMLLAASV